MNLKEQLKAKHKELEELEHQTVALKREILELEQRLNKQAEEPETAFDKTLKGILSVPKPPKD